MGSRPAYLFVSNFVLDMAGAGGIQQSNGINDANG